MSLSKLERAQIIISKIMDLDRTYGTTIPGKISTAVQSTRLIQVDHRWRAFLTPNHRITIGLLTEKSAGTRYLKDPKCILFDLEIVNVPRLTLNMRGSEIELFRYIPGKWEAWFDVDDRDTVSFDRFAYDSRSPEWKALKKSADFQLPPLREGAGLEPKAHANGGFKRRKRLH